MNPIVIYKSKYGSTKDYALWIAEVLGCDAFPSKEVNIGKLAAYDTIIYGDGLYAEMIAGISLITKNFEQLARKNLIVFTTGLTPLDCREYYDEMVMEKNFKPHMRSSVKVFNFMGKMILEELSLPHKAAIVALKKIMGAKENPSAMEKMLYDLCDTSGDFTEKSAIEPLIEYVKKEIS